MRNCVRCGNKIDVFSKNPDKVFYCKKCSLEILKIDEEKLFNKEKEEFTFIPDNMGLYFWVPGIYQLQKGRFLKACTYFYTSLFFPVSWYVFLSLFLASNTVSEYNKKPLYFFSLLVLIQLVMVYLINTKEVKSGINRS